MQPTPEVPFPTDDAGELLGEEEGEGLLGYGGYLEPHSSCSPSCCDKDCECDDCQRCSSFASDDEEMLVIRGDAG
jgi:hypothetical protein